MIAVSVLDCAQEENHEICREFGIQLYPTIKVGASCGAAAAPPLSHLSCSAAAVTLPCAPLQFFHAHSPETDRGTPFRGEGRFLSDVVPQVDAPHCCSCASPGADRQVQAVRQVMVDILQNHTKLDRPDHCPPLDPYRYQHKQPSPALTCSHLSRN